MEFWQSDAKRMSECYPELHSYSLSDKRNAICDMFGLHSTCILVFMNTLNCIYFNTVQFIITAYIHQIANPRTLGIKKCNSDVFWKQRSRSVICQLLW